MSLGMCVATIIYFKLLWYIFYLKKNIMVDTVWLESLVIFGILEGTEVHSWCARHIGSVFCDDQAAGEDRDEDHGHRCR